MLSFVPGEPLPPAAAGEDVVVALARLFRRLHDAAQGWTPPADVIWATLGAHGTSRSSTPGAILVGHRDYCPGSVVFRDGLPMAVFADAYGVSAPQRRDLVSLCRADEPLTIVVIAALTAVAGAAGPDPAMAGGRAGKVAWCRAALDPGGRPPGSRVVRSQASRRLSRNAATAISAAVQAANTP